jgi:hypothetical protein
LEYAEYTTPLTQSSLGWVTITHPFHPLRGQQVEVVLIRRGSDPDLIIRHPDGFQAAVAMSSTDYAIPLAVDPPDGPPHLLDFEGLRRVAQLIERLRQVKTDEDKPCPATALNYD